MKMIISTVTALVLLGLCGCSTTRSVSQLQGHGNKVIYNAPFDATWRAAVDAAQLGELRVIDANRDTGYISAKRGVQVETFGENVGIWVTREGPNQTGVEVVSRQAGPPVLWLKNWEKEMHQTIAANLTREAPYAVGSPAAGTSTVTGSSTTVQPAPTVVTPVPVPSTTVVTPAPAPSTTVVTPAPIAAPPAATIVTTQDAQTQIRTLREQQLARERSLQQEQDAQRRAQLQKEIDDLKVDLQRMQNRLNQLEQEQQRSAPAP